MKWLVIANVIAREDLEDEGDIVEYSAALEDVVREAIVGCIGLDAAVVDISASVIGCDE